VIAKGEADPCQRADQQQRREAQQEDDRIVRQAGGVRGLAEEELAVAA